ncbi:hypothetical protein L1987_64236 [Smallanthus sonchifolius]|uniref:Uncharacterized protein n=1 Tax=Smallanthus sonchifolius TaxID=185202 RepID=A0ACB9CFD3_9ASTR|nr:hypothetical protein L1987_64236 [Smallanthus sonchifolius]
MQKDKKGPNDSAEHCTFCDRDGHAREGCFKLIGYPRWWPGKKGEKAKPKATACVESDASPISGLTKEQYEQFANIFGSGHKPNRGPPTSSTRHLLPTTQGLRSRTLIGSGKCKDGLYQMEMWGSKRQAMATIMDVWYNRLGHAFDSKLRHVNFLKDSLKDKDVFCDSCIKAKHARLPFPISSIKTNACFELIHCDMGSISYFVSHSC